MKESARIIGWFQPHGSYPVPLPSSYTLNHICARPIPSPPKGKKSAQRDLRPSGQKNLCITSNEAQLDTQTPDCVCRFGSLKKNYTCKLRPFDMKTLKDNEYGTSDVIFRKQFQSRTILHSDKKFTTKQLPWQLAICGSIHTKLACECMPGVNLQEKLIEYLTQI